MILDDRGFDDFKLWAQRASDVLAPFGVAPIPREEWQEWGAQLGFFPRLGCLPSPYQYSDWHRWVQDLNLVVNPQQILAWSAIPNFAKTGAFSVNVFTTYFALPSAGWTLTVVGALPAGWTFVSPNLAHAGAVLSGPNTISFKASFSNGLAYSSNSFTVQGI